MALITITATPNNSIPTAISGVVNFFFSSDTNSFCYKDSIGTVVQVFKKSQYEPGIVTDSGSFYKVSPSVEHTIFRFTTPFIIADDTIPINIFNTPASINLVILSMIGIKKNSGISTIMDGSLFSFHHATGAITTDPSINGDLINIILEFVFI